MGTDPWGFDEERQALARRLRDRRLRLSVARTSAFVTFLGILLAGGAVALRSWADGLPIPSWAQVAAFLGVLFGIAALLGLPFAFVGGYVLEVRAGLTARSHRSWLADHGKALALNLVAVLLAGEVLVWLLERAPVWWWLAAWAIGLAASLALGVLAPVLLVPLFLRQRPVSDPGVRGRLEGLARRAGVPVAGVYELEASAKTRRSNAGVMGFGATRRIVVTDTVLREYGPAEVDAILAHELGHERFRDSWVGHAAVAGASLALLAIVAALYDATHRLWGLASLADPAGLVVLALYAGVLSAALGPAELAWSRRRERRADRFALDLTDPEAFASAMVKLHDKNLGVADPRPWEVWLFSSHPPGRARVELARSRRASP